MNLAHYHEANRGLLLTGTEYEAMDALESIAAELRTHRELSFRKGVHVVVREVMLRDFDFYASEASALLCADAFESKRDTKRVVVLLTQRQMNRLPIVLHSATTPPAAAHLLRKFYRAGMPTRAAVIGRQQRDREAIQAAQEAALEAASTGEQFDA